MKVEHLKAKLYICLLLVHVCELLSKLLRICVGAFIVLYMLLHIHEL